MSEAPPASFAHLTEHQLSSEEMFRGKLLHLWRDTVRLPDGGQATREYVRHPGAVVIVPMLDDGHLLLERQYRYPLRRAMLEFPAGKLEAAEPPLLCAQRELLEETGYTAQQWAYAGATHIAIAYSDEIIHIYFARGLKPGPRQLDAGEFLDILSASPQQLMAWARDGSISDAKTLSCLLWLAQVQAGQWALDWKPS